MKLFVWTLVVCSVSVTQVFSLPGLPINLSDSVHHTPSPPLETDNNPSTSLSLSSPGGSGLHRSPREHNLLNLDKSTTPGPSDGHAAEQDDVQPLHLTHLREPDTDDNNTGAEQQQQRSGTREAGTTRSPSRSRREGSSTLNRRGMILSKLSGKDGQSKNGESEKSRSKSGVALECPPSTTKTELAVACATAGAHMTHPGPNMHPSLGPVSYQDLIQESGANTD